MEKDWPRTFAGVSAYKDNEWWVVEAAEKSPNIVEVHVSGEEEPRERVADRSS